MAPVEVTFWEPVKARVGSVDEKDLKRKEGRTFRLEAGQTLKVTTGEPPVTAQFSLFRAVRRIELFLRTDSEFSIIQSTPPGVNRATINLFGGEERMDVIMQRCRERDLEDEYPLPAGSLVDGNGFLLQRVE